MQRIFQAAAWLLAATIVVLSLGPGKLHGSGDVVGRLQSAVSQKVFRREAILRRRIFERTSRSLRVRTR
jgi:hypothetical protein